MDSWTLICMCFLEGGQWWTRFKEGGDWFGGVLEDEAALSNVAHVVLVKADDCIIEVDGVEEGDGSASFDEGNGLV